MHLVGSQDAGNIVVGALSWYPDWWEGRPSGIMKLLPTIKTTFMINNQESGAGLL